MILEEIKEKQNVVVLKCFYIQRYSRVKRKRKQITESIVKNELKSDSHRRKKFVLFV